MVWPPAQMGLYAFLLVAVFFGLVFVLVKGYKGRETIPPVSVPMVAIVGGYLASNTAFLAQEEQRDLPELAETDGGDGHTAIIFFIHGKPLGYSAMPWIETIRELDHDKVPFIP